MINNISIKSGVLANLIGKVKLEFTDDVNLIYGANGKGKSLLMKTLAEFCMVDEIGASTHQWYGLRKDQYSKLTKFKCQWSGDSAFYLDDNYCQDWHTNVGYEMGTGERIKGWNYMKLAQAYTSNGGFDKTFIERLLDLEVENVDLSKSSSYKRYELEKEFSQYQKTLGQKKTLLLDEIDSHLSIPNQKWFFQEVLPKLAEKYQVIVISHSVFALNTSYNVVALDDTYQENKQIIKETFQNL